jgi:hypothetical protein
MPYTVPLLILCFAFYQLCVPTPCYSQTINPDTSFLALSRKKSIELYTRATQNQSKLYNGSDYIIYQPKDEEHPYFEVDDWTYGSIVYDGDLYENVALMYDINIDKVITEHNRGNSIKLLDEKIQRFSILNHTFVRLNGDDSTKISAGFYDQLYGGASKVIAKHVKTYQESLDQGEIIPRFEESTQYYIIKNDVYFPVKSKGSVLKVFDDRKQEIKDFVKKNRISFKANREEAIARMAEFYDTQKK